MPLSSRLSRGASALALAALAVACGRVRERPQATAAPDAAADAARPPTEGGGAPHDAARPADAGLDAGAVAAPDAAIDCPLGRDAGADASVDLDGGALPPTPPSCEGLLQDCGPCRDEDCCASPLVPGGDFFRDHDGVFFTGRDLPATVSSFRLDRFEVTVGRFRRFRDAWDRGYRPAPGSGKHSHLHGGLGLRDASGTTEYEQGWDPTWPVEWPSELEPSDANLMCEFGVQNAWTPEPGLDETRPVGCVQWYEAYAFCIWDGGFLPSQTELDYAAGGGDEQRVYPWSSPPTDTHLDCSLANYAEDLEAGRCCSRAPWCTTAPVGSRSPRGDGRFGQADLSGNASEFTLDSDLWEPTCVDCAFLPPAVPLNERLRENGGAMSMPSIQRVASDRWWVYAPWLFRRGSEAGIRCARAP